MNWKQKAALMRICASLPGGVPFYEFLQKRFGRLKARPLYRAETFCQMSRFLSEHNHDVRGATVFEVGTGHIPRLPLCFFLGGAAEVVTCDLNNRLQWKLLSECLSWFSANELKTLEALGLDVNTNGIDARLAMVSDYKNDPKTFLAKAGIRYLAPADAAKTNLIENTFDLHVSTTTFEHIPHNVLLDIMHEGHRLLKPSGKALHFVDLGDHFKYLSNELTLIHFLQFEDKEWSKYNDNEFAYCNRLRAPQYRKIFDECGFDCLKEHVVIDTDSLAALRNEVVVPATEFSTFNEEELCTTSLQVLLHPKSLQE